GAVGRVFLARQSHLANRLVVVKVSAHSDNEPYTLAQMQHTNIVPIYSVHLVGPLQVVCMPYYGATTLAQIIADLGQFVRPLPTTGRDLLRPLYERKSKSEEPPADEGAPKAETKEPRAKSPEHKTKVEEPKGKGEEPKVEVGEQRAKGESPKIGDSPLWAFRSPLSALRSRLSAPLQTVTPESAANLDLLAGLTHVGAAIWLTARIADGLAHAHERGILHCDLKPANVLLTNDGQPMLLDFNVATRGPRPTGPHPARVGGT